MLTRLAPFLSLVLLACSGATTHTRFADPATLAAEREEWRGDRGGLVVLRYHVEAVVDTRPDPSQAESRLVIHLAATRFADVPVTVELPLPSGAERVRAEVRQLAPEGPPVKAELVSDTGGRGDLDPGSGVRVVTLPPPPEGGVVEAILEYKVAGTLASDARNLGFWGGPTAEVLLRYDLPSDAVGGFHTTLPGARPIVTQKEGRTLIALLAQNLPARSREVTTPVARYVTRTAAPLGYAQDFASSWARVVAPYQAKLVGRAAELERGFEVPFRAADVETAYAWVKDRPSRRNALGARWDEGQALPEAIAQNKLTAVDKVQLLHWLLREAKLPHAVAMAREPSLPPLDPAFPVPDAFSTPLIYAPTLGLFLDPGCDECAMGEVREGLRGGQAILLPPVGDSPLLPLPGRPAASTP